MIESLMRKLTLKIVSIIALTLLFIILLAWGPQACTSYFSAKKKSDLDQANVKAITDSVEKTSEVIDENDRDAENITQIVKEAKNEIRKSPDGLSNDAAVRAACRMRSHINSERCASMRKADSAKLENGNSVR